MMSPLPSIFQSFFHMNENTNSPPEVSYQVTPIDDGKSTKSVSGLRAIRSDRICTYRTGQDGLTYSEPVRIASQRFLHSVSNILVTLLVAHVPRQPVTG